MSDTTIIVFINEHENKFDDSESFKKHLTENKDINSVSIQHGDVTLTDPEELFRNSKLKTFETEKNITLIGDCGGMFQGAKSFNGNLSRWNVSNVTNMEGMFGDAKSFNGDLSSWDVSKVTNMIDMFANATSFNGDLSSWDVSKDTYTVKIIN